VFNATPQLGGNASDATAPGASSSAVAGFTAWLADIQHRIGTRLFMAADEEAYWRGWRITERWGGLARGYRDPRFGATLSARSAPGI
jgi:hypothetical protein